jgi:hypothetical protein
VTADSMCDLDEIRRVFIDNQLEFVCHRRKEEREFWLEKLAEQRDAEDTVLEQACLDTEME